MQATRAKQLLKNGIYRAIGETVAGTGALDGEGGRTLRALMYHKVNDVPGNPVTVPTSLFDEQMAQLRELGYQAVGLDAVVAHYTRGEPLPPGATLITFDEAAREIVVSKLRLEEALGRPVQAFAFVKGSEADYLPVHLSLVRQAGYELGFTSVSGANGPRSDRFRLRRYNVEPYPARTFELVLRGACDLIAVKDTVAGTYARRASPAGGLAPESREPRMYGDVRVEPLERFPPEVDDVWREAAPGYGNHVVRDARFLNWRYADTPRTYRRFGAYRDGRLRAVVIVGHTVKQGVSSGFLADLVSPL